MMQTEARALARQAQLRYVTDAGPGISRRRRGTGFSYHDPSGRRITDAAERLRFSALAIPPAWTGVWICPLPHGHIQAIGRDARGRKQYLYHARWMELAQQVKFDNLLDFGRALPKVRRQVDGDLRRRAMDRQKVVAAVIALLDETLIRVGNDSYARDNNTFGLTTLRRKHVRITPTTARFRFSGKGGALHEVDLHDRRLVRVLHRCCEIPGQELFQYVDAEDQAFYAVDSEDVNAYLRETAGPSFSAKDFRTWAGTAIMAGLLYRVPDPDSRRGRQAVLRQAYRQVAGALRNTIAVCRRHYVHPQLAERFLEGRLQLLYKDFVPRRRRWYSSDEQLSLHLLEQL